MANALAINASQKGGGGTAGGLSETHELRGREETNRGVLREGTARAVVRKLLSSSQFLADADPATNSQNLRDRFAATRGPSGGSHHEGSHHRFLNWRKRIVKAAPDDAIPNPSGHPLEITEEQHLVDVFDDVPDVPDEAAPCPPRLLTLSAAKSPLRNQTSYRANPFPEALPPQAVSPEEEENDANDSQPRGAPPEGRRAGERRRSGLRRPGRLRLRRQTIAAKIGTAGAAQIFNAVFCQTRLQRILRPTRSRHENAKRDEVAPSSASKPTSELTQRETGPPSLAPSDSPADAMRPPLLENVLNVDYDGAGQGRASAGLIHDLLAQKVGGRKQGPPTAFSGERIMSSGVVGFLTPRELARLTPVCSHWWAELSSRPNLRLLWPIGRVPTTRQRQRLWALVLFGEAPRRYTSDWEWDLAWRSARVQIRTRRLSYQDIGKDVPRTFSVLPAPFSPPSPSSSGSTTGVSFPAEELEKVIITALMNATRITDYCQGLNYIAALFLLAFHFDSRAACEAFRHWLFTDDNIRYFDYGFEQVLLDIAKLVELVTEIYPTLTGEIERQNVLLETVLFPWTLLRFAYRFDKDAHILKMTLALWDQFLLCDETFLFTVVLSMLGSLDERLRKAKEEADAEARNGLDSLPDASTEDWNLLEELRSLPHKYLHSFATEKGMMDHLAKEYQKFKPALRSMSLNPERSSNSPPVSQRTTPRSTPDPAPKNFSSSYSSSAGFCGLPFTRSHTARPEDGERVEHSGASNLGSEMMPESNVRNDGAKAGELGSASTTSTLAPTSATIEPAAQIIPPFSPPLRNARRVRRK